MGIWMVVQNIYEDPNSTTGFKGKGNYVGIELCSNDTTLVEGDYYFSDSGDPMTWYEGEFGYPYDWTNATGDWEWLKDGVINVAKQNGVYTFTFILTSESNNTVEGQYTGTVIPRYSPIISSLRGVHRTTPFNRF